jgi:hypothetical protein
MNMRLKKILKITMITLVVVLALIAIAIPVGINYLRNKSTLKTFDQFSESAQLQFVNIKWDSSIVAGIKFEKAAFFIPVKVKGIQKRLYMQFDSGSASSLFYGKTLQAIDAGLDTSFSQKDSAVFAMNVVLEIGSATFHADKMEIRQDMGSFEIDTSFIIIGTIGYDAVVNRTLIMDFKQDKLAITQKLPDSLNSNINYIDGVSVNKFPFFIKATIGDDQVTLGYDTGSSLFPLITSNRKLANLNKSVKLDTLCCVSSWGVDHPIYRKKYDQLIKLGNTVFKDEYIYSSHQFDVLDYVPNWLFFGGTGNSLFLNKVVYVDTKHNKFGLVD